MTPVTVVHEVMKVYYVVGKLVKSANFASLSNRFKLRVLSKGVKRQAHAL